MENNIDILIIEDEALIAENIKMELEDFGYTITDTCYTYEAAIRQIKKNNYDLVLTDINLGNGTESKSGLQIIEQLKQIKNCPFIFLTAFSDKDTIKKAAAFSPSAYLIKPVNTASLFAAIQLAVENFSTHKTAKLEEDCRTDYFFIKQGNKMIKVFWKEVYHLEAVKNYVKIKTTEYSSGLMLRGSLQDVLLNRMPSTFRSNFIKINRAEALDKKIIKEFGKGLISTNYGEFKTSADFKLEDLQ